MNEADSKADPRTDDQQVRDRAVRLFTFLREITELRSKTIRTIEQYDKVLWFKEIPREPGCDWIAWRPVKDEEKSDVWVEIKKPRLKPPPKVADPLGPWLDVQPKILPEVWGRTLVAQTRERESHPHTPVLPPSPPVIARSSSSKVTTWRG